jgi:hypothetical protein
MADHLRVKGVGLCFLDILSRLAGPTANGLTSAISD